MFSDQICAKLSKNLSDPTKTLLFDWLTFSIANGAEAFKETELIIYGMQGKARSTRKSTKLNTGGPVWNVGSNIETGPAVRYVHHLFSL